MSFEYMPCNEFYITILLREIQQYLRDPSLQGLTANHDRIMDLLLIES